MLKLREIILFINLTIFSLGFLGCSLNIPTPKERNQIAINLTNNKNIIQKDMQTSQFNLFSIQDIQSDCSKIKIFIEGDGLSWISRTTISSNPTPITPVGLKLMLSDDKSSCKIYLARPCQYVNSNICEEKYWTSHRFNEKVIQSYDEALTNLKKDFPNSKFDLIGYSGGGAVVTLVANNRDDINSITTIAGNLDIDEWTKIQKVTPLNGSLNPVNYTKKLQKIKQHHLIGMNDNVVPKEVFFSYLNKFEDKSNISYSFYNASHSCCWEDIYMKFLKELNL